jgi:hypothetical protein
MASANYRVFTMGSKKVLVSYETVVSVFDTTTQTLTTTNKFYSNTTSKHKGKFLKECNPLHVEVVEALDPITVTYSAEYTRG